MRGTLIKLHTKTVWRSPLGRSPLECKLLYNHYLCHNEIFLFNTIFISNFRRPRKTCRCNIECQIAACVPISMGNVSKLLYTKILTCGFPGNINIFAKTLSFYSPSLIFLKERLALLKILHKMMTVCDPVFSLAITLGPKTLFQPLIESITVASHPLFHAFLHRCLFSFLLFSSENNATFFQQQLQITFQSLLPFSELITGKSQVFNTLVCVFPRIYACTWQG